MPANRQIPEKDIPLAKGMLLRQEKNKELGLPHDDQHDIAWYFGVNNGRVNELKMQSTAYARRFADVPPAPEEELPPPGPYPSAREFFQMLETERMLTAAAIGIADWRARQAEADTEAEVEHAESVIDTFNIVAAQAKADLAAARRDDRVELDDALNDIQATANAEILKAQKETRQAWAIANKYNDLGRAAKGESQALRDKMDQMAKTMRTMTITMEELARPATPPKTPTPIATTADERLASLKARFKRKGVDEKAGREHDA